MEHNFNLGNSMHIQFNLLFNYITICDAIPTDKCGRMLKIMYSGYSLVSLQPTFQLHQRTTEASSSFVLCVNINSNILA